MLQRFNNLVIRKLTLYYEVFFFLLISNIAILLLWFIYFRRVMLNLVEKKISMCQNIKTVVIYYCYTIIITFNHFIFKWVELKEEHKGCSVHFKVCRLCFIHLICTTYIRSQTGILRNQVE